MPKATLPNGITLEYEVIGADEPVIVLIMGLHAQLLVWDDRFCEALAARGFRVLRFDNRDAGLSSRVPDAPPGELAYTMDDMATDVAALLDALHIDAAHVVGMSMGGIIAQLVAINHPGRVLSLCSISSSCGPDVGRPRPGAFSAMLGDPPSTRTRRWTARSA